MAWQPDLESLDVRYEFVSPVTGSVNVLSTWIVAPDIPPAVVPVFPGQNGPYSGKLPNSLGQSRLEQHRTKIAPCLVVRPEDSSCVPAWHQLQPRRLHQHGKPIL